MGQCMSLHSGRGGGDGGDGRRPTQEVKKRRRWYETKPTGAGGDAASHSPSSSSQTAAAAASAASAEELFLRYRDPNGEAVVGEAGVSALCSDLGLDPVDIRVLLLAWLCGASEMCRFGRDQFCRGCRRLGAGSVVQLRRGLDDKLAGMLADADNGAEFLELYRWSFDFGLEPGQRALTLAMAADLWGLVFLARAAGQPPLLRPWLSWLLGRAHGAKVVTRDTWLMFLTFCDAHSDDLAGYDQNEAWPSLIDEFVEAETDRANQNLSS